MQDKVYIPYSVLLFFGILSLYISLIIFLDNTNITTTNGLYKSMETFAWETGRATGFDSGGYLYGYSMGMISKLIPNSLVSFYGEVSNFIAYRKLAWINSVFGAASSTVVFSLSYQVTKDKFWALCTALVHAFSAFILINSIISEDIIPGYFFFTLSFLFLYKGLYENPKYLTASTLCAVMMLFLHWTLLPPLAAAYLCVAGFLIYNDGSYLFLFLKQVALLFIFVFIGAKLFNFFSKGTFNLQLTVGEILYPAKAEPTSFIGFGWSKFEALFAGVGNYLVGGKNLPPPLVADSLLMVRMIASWILTIGGIGLFIKELLRENRRELKVVAIFGLSIFFFAQAQNIYVQPQDPQFQVQPMFIITLGLIICYFQDSVKKYVKSLLPILVLIIGMDNFIMLQPFRGADAIMVKNFAEFRDHFPKNSTKIVHLGYEQWSSWLMLFDYESSWNMYLKDITTLNSPFHFKHGISIQEAANQITDEIDAALISGKRVIVTSPWVNDSSNEYIYELAALNLTKEQLIQYKEILLKPYQIKNVYTLKWGKFAEIEKKK